MNTKLQWYIPHKILDATSAVLASKREEVFVMWSASLDDKQDNIYRISRYIVPKQDSHTSPMGVYVHIDGAELARIAFDNYDKKERNVVQLHTHPSTNVRMSQLDREWEVVNHVGALSIIVPDYGRRGLSGFPGVNVYEREEDDWRLWEAEEVKRRMVILP